MNIDIILPYKEIFSADKASAVSLTIKNSAQFSEFNSIINVFGQMTPQPFKGLKFNGIKTNPLLHFGNNNSILFNYFKMISNLDRGKKIIEIPYVHPPDVEGMSKTASSFLRFIKLGSIYIIRIFQSLLKRN